MTYASFNSSYVAYAYIYIFAFSFIDLSTIQPFTKRHIYAKVVQIMQKVLNTCIIETRRLQQHHSILLNTYKHSETVLSIKVHSPTATETLQTTETGCTKLLYTDATYSLILWVPYVSTV